MKVFKKVTSLFLAALLTLSALAVVPFTAAAETPTLTAVEADATWGVTTGVDGDTYYIADKYDLQAFAASCVDYTGKNVCSYTGKKVLLTADIDMEGMLWTSSNIDFAGEFDGQGHTISNFTGVRTSGNYAFFDYVRCGGSVKNVSFVNVDIYTNKANSAILARATNETATFENVYVEGKITHTGANINGSYGGFVGQVAGGTTTFTNCVSDYTYVNACTGTATAPDQSAGSAGGFVSIPNVDATINMTDCVFIGDLSQADAGSAGLVANWSHGTKKNTTSTLTRCVVLGRVSEISSASPTLIYIAANTTMAHTVNMTDCFFAHTDDYGVLAAGGDTKHVVTANYTNGSKSYTSPKSPAVTLAEDQGNFKAYFLENALINETSIALLKNNGWVMTGKTVEYATGKTVPEIMPESVADMITNPATVSYWQVKAGSKVNTNDFRFVAKINFADLTAYDEVGYEVTVKVQGGDTLINKQQITTNKVYTSIKAGDDVKLAADLDANYLIALSINGFKNADTTYEVTITPIVKCGTSVIHDADHTVTGTITGNVFTQD